MSIMYCDDHLVRVTLCGLGVDASTRCVTGAPVMSAISLLVVTRSIEGFKKRAAVGDNTPGLQDGQSSEALVYADESKLTAVEGDRLKAVLTLS